MSTLRLTVERQVPLEQVYDVLTTEVSSPAPLVIAAGMLSAGVVGYLAIAFLLRYLRRNSTDVFVYYRWALAAMLVVLALARG